MNCPCCGQTVDDALPLNGLPEIKMAPVQTGMIRMLVAAYPGHVTMDDFQSSLYRHTDGYETIKVQLSKLRVKLSGYGWSIADARGTRKYRLVAG